MRRIRFNTCIDQPHLQCAKSLNRFILRLKMCHVRRQEHFRSCALDIVPRVNEAIALARRLNLPIFYSQHGMDWRETFARVCDMSAPIRACMRVCKLLTCMRCVWYTQAIPTLP